MNGVLRERKKLDFSACLAQKACYHSMEQGSGP
jgi:hypothetical protein